MSMMSMRQNTCVQLQNSGQWHSIHLCLEASVTKGFPGLQG